MSYKVVANQDIVNEFERFSKTGKLLNNLDDNHKRIRDFFVENYNELKKTYHDYELDCELAFRFYKFLNEQDDDMLELQISDYDFWKYIAVFDIPDIVADRFGIESLDHFYNKGTRVYPFTLYWYIFLSWQGDENKTRLVTRGKSTDIILQLVERPSKLGVNQELFREIMNVFGRITNGGNDAKLFRLILKRNTAKMLVYRPEFYPGGVEGYVKMIFGEQYE